MRHDRFVTGLLMLGVGFVLGILAVTTARKAVADAGQGASAPTVEHLCRGALHSTRAQAEKLEQMIDVKWGQTATPAP